MRILYRFGEFELDAKEEILSRDGKVLPINRRAFQVLHLLVERAGDTVTKEEFFEAVWENAFVEENNLSVAAAILRKALNDDPKAPRFIETIPRRGYRFIAEVVTAETKASQPVNAERVSDEAVSDAVLPADSAVSVTSAEASGGTHVFFRSRKVLFSAVACIFLLLLIGAGFKYLSPDSFPITASRIFPSAKPAFESVAVLPFVHAEADSEYLADGFTEALTDDLSHIQDIRVISGESTARFKGEGTNTDEVAKRLNVQAIVTGKFEHTDNNVFLNLALTDTTNNTVIWKTQYRLTAKNLIQVQKLIARDTAINLRVRPSEGRNRYEPDQQAYILYLKGKYYWNRRSDAIDESYDKAVELFKEALNVDPGYALPYVGLANAYGQMSGGCKYCPRTPPERLEIVNGYLAKALELDPTLSDTYASMGMSDLYLGAVPQWKNAEANFTKALELEPSNASAQHWLAEYLALTGRFDESFAAYDRAIALEPLSMAVRGDKCYAIWFARRYDEAVTCMENVRDLDPLFKRTHSYLLSIYASAERYDDLIETLRTVEHDNAMKKYAEEDYNSLKTALKTGGRSGFWTAYLHIWSREKSSWVMAICYAQLGEKDKAFEQLNKAIDSGGGNLAYLPSFPTLAPLHDDPRWKTIRTRVGLEP